jgi:hypothetical protein
VFFATNSCGLPDSVADLATLITLWPVPVEVNWKLVDMEPLIVFARLNLYGEYQVFVCFGIFFSVNSNIDYSLDCIYFFLSMLSDVNV